MNLNPLAKVIVDTRKCPFCGKRGAVTVPKDGYERWKAGEAIQAAMPEVPKGIREQLMTGFHSECFDDAIPEED